MLVVKNVLGTDFCLNQADAWDFMGSGRVGTIVDETLKCFYNV
jgi:hypothetical protein